jgi:hypothetical protein
MLLAILRLIVKIDSISFAFMQAAAECLIHASFSASGSMTIKTPRYNLRP